MNSHGKFTVLMLVSFVLLLAFTSGATFAASSATFTFDFVTDPGDGADGPDYNVVGTGLVDDNGLSCDVVVMVMVDPTGAGVDVDSFCLSLATGLGGSDGDYGSFGTGYLPVASPITYALYDIDAADLAALSLAGLGDADQGYLDYVVANGTLLVEQFLDETDLGIPAATPFSFAAPVGVVADPSVCSVAIPEGSVVGDAPFGAQVYWSPGNVSPGVILNPGTYHVIGQDESQTFYKLFFNCQYIWVLKDTMQPSYLPPQNGAPLPTRIIG
jgi:hypothetical protein